MSAKTCSTMAWSRCCPSAWTSSNGESVNTAWYRLALVRRERRVLCFGDLGVGDPGLQLVVPDRARVPDRRPGILADRGNRGADARVHGHGDGEPRTGAADRADYGGVVVGRVQPHDQEPRAAAGPGGADGAGGQAGRAARGGGVPAAQPRGRYHWRR